MKPLGWQRQPADPSCPECFGSGTLEVLANDNFGLTDIRCPCTAPLPPTPWYAPILHLWVALWAPAPVIYEEPTDDESYPF